MFVEVKNTDMVVGIKYAILHCMPNIPTYSTGTFKNREGDCVHHFHYIKKHYYIENTYFYNEYQRLLKTDATFKYYAYVSKKDKIQRRMEKRALDKILKRLVGDELFVW